MYAKIIVKPLAARHCYYYMMMTGAEMIIYSRLEMVLYRFPL